MGAVWVWCGCGWVWCGCSVGVVWVQCGVGVGGRIKHGDLVLDIVEQIEFLNSKFLLIGLSQLQVYFQHVDVI